MTTATKKRTKPAFRPTPEERQAVQQMSAMGMPQESIARVIRSGIDGKTLRKHFREELDTASIKANATIGGKLYQLAAGGDMQAIKFWLQTRARWSIATDPEEVKPPVRVIVQYADAPMKVIDARPADTD